MNGMDKTSKRTKMSTENLRATSNFRFVSRL